jgi:uncharacterized protein (DUF362 family)
VQPTEQPTRRDALKMGGVSLATAGAIAGTIAGTTACSTTRSVSVPQPSQVAILKCESYRQSIYETVARALDLCRVPVRGKNVVLKPNLVEFEAGSSINTNPMVVHAALEAFRAQGAASVRIAEGPGHRRNTLDLADAAGYFHIIPGFEDLFTDLNLDDVTRVPLKQPRSKLKSLYLPHTVLGADLLVSMPKLKTHHWVGATLSMKNLFGVVPGGVYGWPKNPLHWAGISDTIVDLHNMFPRQFALVDGVVGMEGNGPIQGTPKTAGVIVAGSHMAAVDATCCRLMQIDPDKISYLVDSTAPGEIAAANIHQIGETVSNNSTRFTLIKEWEQLRLEMSKG